MEGPRSATWVNSADLMTEPCQCATPAFADTALEEVISLPSGRHRLGFLLAQALVDQAEGSELVDQAAAGQEYRAVTCQGRKYQTWHSPKPYLRKPQVLTMFPGPRVLIRD